MQERAKVKWVETSSCRYEAWNDEPTPVYVVFAGSPGQTSSPDKVVEVPPKGFIGTSSAMLNSRGVFKNRAMAESIIS